MVNFHPPAELLLDYASGALSEGANLAIETHIAMCQKCETDAGRLMAVGGALIDDLQGVEIAANAVTELFRRVDEDIVKPKALKKHVKTVADDLPHPLNHYLPNGLAGCSWRKVGPWFEETRLKVASSTTASLMRLKAGSLMPRHTHRGSEMTVVLAGGYSDNGVSYGPGDFSLKDVSDHHQPRVDDDGTCLCLVVLEAPVRLTSGFGRLASMFVGPR